MTVALFPIPHLVLNIEQSTMVPKNLKYEMQMPSEIGKYIFERAIIWLTVKWSQCCSPVHALPPGLSPEMCPLVRICLPAPQAPGHSYWVCVLLTSMGFEGTLETHRTHFESQPCRLLAVWPWAGVFTSLSYPLVIIPISKRFKSDDTSEGTIIRAFNVMI